MTDEEIMEGVKNGDLEQASLLFERYHKRIFNFLARISFDRVLAEDLTQNVFLRIIKYRSSYHKNLRFQSWIYQIARNVFADHYQATKKHKNFVDVEHLANHTDDTAEQDEKEQLLERSMALLTNEQRELLVLTRFQHLKYEEVASMTNTSVANIKVKIHRAIGKLREYYFELEKSH